MDGYGRGQVSLFTQSLLRPRPLSGCPVETRNWIDLKSHWKNTTDVRGRRRRGAVRRRSLDVPRKAETREEREERVLNYANPSIHLSRFGPPSSVPPRIGLFHVALTSIPSCPTATDRDRKTRQNDDRPTATDVQRRAELPPNNLFRSLPGAALSLPLARAGWVVGS